jgi:hypothetical protein
MARFRDQVATLAAAIIGFPKDDIEGEDVRQQRRTRRTVQTVIAVLTALVVGVSVLAVVANSQREKAIFQRQDAILVLQRQSPRVDDPSRPRLLEGLVNLRKPLKCSWIHNCNKCSCSKRSRQHKIWPSCTRCQDVSSSKDCYNKQWQDANQQRSQLAHHSCAARRPYGYLKSIVTE